jgi:hypothetical protein
VNQEKRPNLRRPVSNLLTLLGRELSSWTLGIPVAA